MNSREMTESLKEKFGPEVEPFGVEIYDVQFVYENGEHILRFFIEKEEGFVSMEDCEAVSEYLSDRLDEVDPIDTGYLLEVSSVGIDKPFERERDYKKNLGNVVELKFYGSYKGQKMVKGVLKDYDEDSVTVELLNKKGEIEFPKNQLNWVRFAIFDN